MATREEIQAAIEEKRKRESALEQVAAQQTQGMPMAQPVPNRGFVDKLLGMSQDEPTRRNQMSVVEGILNRPRGTTAIGGAASGMQRGAALMDEIRGRQRQEQMQGAQVGVDSAGQAVKDTVGQYGRAQAEEAAGVAAEKEQYRRQRDLVKDRQFDEKLESDNLGRERDISVNTEKQYREYWEAKNSANANASEYEQLAQQFNEADYSGGTPTQLKEMYKKWVGSEDKQSALIDAGRRVVVSSAIQQLPPGVASDKDIELVMFPQPSNFANPKYLSEYLSARARMERLNAEYNQFVLSYMDQNKAQGHTLVGVDSAWREHKAQQKAQEQSAMDASGLSPAAQKYYKQAGGAQ
jgi:hypothetical protein